VRGLALAFSALPLIHGGQAAALHIHLRWITVAFHMNFFPESDVFPVEFMGRPAVGRSDEIRKLIVSSDCQNNVPVEAGDDETERRLYQDAANIR